ncbi:MAG: RNA polymerase sigma factor [Elusimicrobia bacterium]|nr:RNA polymerase sigma factor [Elusimicrobiota bacterium]
MAEPGFTEEELVLKSQKGDRAAFEALMETTLARTWSLAWRLSGNLTDAEDLVQETYMKAWSNIGKFRGQSGFATWLYRIQLNLYHDTQRIKSRRREVSLDAKIGDDDAPAPQPADPGPDAPRQLETAEELSAVRKTLDSLDPVYRRVLVLRHLEELSYEAIGRLLDVPVGTVAAWLFRARDAFRKAYTQLYGEKV